MTQVMALQFHIIEYKPTEQVFVRSARINIHHSGGKLWYQEQLNWTGEIIIELVKFCTFWSTFVQHCSALYSIFIIYLEIDTKTNAVIFELNLV